MQTGTMREGAILSPIARALCAVLPVALVAFAGSRVTLPAIPAWYAGLAKPPLTPPNAVFGPAWTILYVLMAIALYRVLSQPATDPGRGRAVAAYAVQLALNCLWSVVFFGARSPALALAVIAALLLAIVWSLLAFRRVDPVAALLLLPYLGWVLFATYLNAGVLLLNPGG